MPSSIFIQDNFAIRIIALNLVKSSSRNSKAPEVSRTIGNRNGCTFVRVCQDENMLQLASPGLQELPTIFIQTSNVNIFSICLNKYQVCFPFDNFSGLAMRGHPWSTCAPRREGHQVSFQKYTGKRIMVGTWFEFVPAVYLSCLTLPGSFLTRFTNLFSLPCTCVGSI